MNSKSTDKGDKINNVIGQINFNLTLDLPVTLPTQNEMRLEVCNKLIVDSGTTAFLFHRGLI